MSESDLAYRAVIIVLDKVAKDQITPKQKERIANGVIEKLSRGRIRVWD